MCAQMRPGHKWGSQGNWLPGGGGHCQPRQGVLISALGVPGQQVACNTSSNTCISPLSLYCWGK